MARAHTENSKLSFGFSPCTVALTLLSAMFVVSCSPGQGGTGTPAGTGGKGSGGNADASVSGSGGNNSAATGGNNTSGSGGSTSGSGGQSTSGSGGQSNPDGGSAGSGGGGGGNGVGSGGTSSGSGGGTSNGGGNSGSGGATGGGSGTGGVAGSGSGGAVVVACQAPASVTGTAVTVSVSLGTVRATVNADLMGVHTSVYDNNLRAPTTPPLLKAAGVRSLRYPGGSYGDVYHWSTHTASIQNKGATSEVMPYVAMGTDFGNFIGLIESVGAGGMITVNYGSNPQGTGPGVPQEAAAWVAYANGSPSSTVAIGVDETGTDWKTVGYWASLRAADKLAVDDGQNFLRISHPNSAGIKYWEVGNELYGNGYYYGGEGWEEDLHLLHDGTPRKGNANLSPAKYGAVFPLFAQAMKAVDPNIKVGAILHWPYTEYAAPNNTDWNDSVLTAATCSAMDFGVNHWYAGSNLTDLLTRARRDIPMMFSELQTKVSTRCPSRTGTVQLAITEWGPNYLNFNVTPPAQTQMIGVFAADSYANFMEQGAITVDWLELHNDSYLGPMDVAAWGYKGQQMASYLANGGDTMVQATVQNPPTAFTGGLFQAHASKHADGSVAIMLVNTTPGTVAAATVNVTGLASGEKLPCVGTQYSYTPMGTDADGAVTSTPIFSTNDTNNRVSVAVPGYSVVVITFPKS